MLRLNNYDGLEDGRYISNFYSNFSPEMTYAQTMQQGAKNEGLYQATILKDREGLVKYLSSIFKDTNWEEMSDDYLMRRVNGLLGSPKVRKETKDKINALGQLDIPILDWLRINSSLEILTPERRAELDRLLIQKGKRPDFLGTTEESLKVKDVLFFEQGKNNPLVIENLKQSIVSELGFNPWNPDGSKKILSEQDDAAYKALLNSELARYTTDKRLGNTRFWKPIQKRERQEIRRRLSTKERLLESEIRGEQAFNQFLEQNPDVARQFNQQDIIQDFVGQGVYPSSSFEMGGYSFDDALDLKSRFTSQALLESIREGMRSGDIGYWDNGRLKKFTKTQEGEILDQLRAINQSTPINPRQAVSDYGTIKEIEAIGRDRPRFVSGEEWRKKIESDIGIDTPFNQAFADTGDAPIISYQEATEPEKQADKILNIDDDTSGLDEASGTNVNVDDIDTDSTLSLADIVQDESIQTNKEQVFREVMDDLTTYSTEEGMTGRIRPVNQFRQIDADKLINLFELEDAEIFMGVDPTNISYEKADAYAQGKPDPSRRVLVSYGVTEQDKEYARQIINAPNASELLNSETEEILRGVLDARTDGNEQVIAGAPTSLMSSPSLQRRSDFLDVKSKLNPRQRTQEELKLYGEDRQLLTSLGQTTMLPNQSDFRTLSLDSPTPQYASSLIRLDPYNLGSPAKAPSALSIPIDERSTEINRQKQLRLLEEIATLESLPNKSGKQQMRLKKAIEESELYTDKGSPLSLRSPNYDIGNISKNIKVYSLSPETIGQSPLGGFSEEDVQSAILNLYEARQPDDNKLRIDVSGSDIDIANPQERSRLIQYLDNIASDRNYKHTDTVNNSTLGLTKPMTIYKDGMAFDVSPEERLSLRGKTVTDEALVKRGVMPRENPYTYRAKSKTDIGIGEAIAAHTKLNAPEQSDALPDMFNLEGIYRGTDETGNNPYFDSYSGYNDIRKRFQFLSDEQDSIDERVRARFTDSIYTPLQLDRDSLEEVLELSRMYDEGSLKEPPIEVLELEEKLANPYVQIGGQYYPVYDPMVGELRDLDTEILTEQLTQMDDLNKTYQGRNIPRHELENVQSSYLSNWLNQEDNKNKLEFTRSEVYGSQSPYAHLKAEFRETKPEKTAYQAFSDLMKEKDKVEREGYELDIEYERLESQLDELIESGGQGVEMVEQRLDKIDKRLNTLSMMDDYYESEIDKTRKTLEFYNALSTPSDIQLNVRHQTPEVISPTSSIDTSMTQDELAELERVRKLVDYRRAIAQKRLNEEISLADGIRKGNYNPSTLTHPLPDNWYNNAVPYLILQDKIDIPEGDIFGNVGNGKPVQMTEPLTLFGKRISTPNDWFTGNITDTVTREGKVFPLPISVDEAVSTGKPINGVQVLSKHKSGKPPALPLSGLLNREGWFDGQTQQTIPTLIGKQLSPPSGITYPVPNPTIWDSTFKESKEKKFVNPPVYDINQDAPRFTFRRIEPTKKLPSGDKGLPSENNTPSVEDTVRKSNIPSVEDTVRKSNWNSILNHKATPLVLGSAGLGALLLYNQRNKKKQKEDEYPIFMLDDGTIIE